MQTTLINENPPTKEKAHGAWQRTHARFGPWALASCTATGLRHLAQRQPGEDSIAHRELPHGGVVVALADGVSGGACGLDASTAAVGYCVGTPSQQFCALALDQAVQSAIARCTDAKGATTLAAAWLNGQGQGHLLHVGDCRIYHWRAADHQLCAVTVDETYTNLGELPPPHIPPDNPARMLGLGLGADGDDLPHRQPIHLYAGDMLLLCSDGMHAFLTQRELASFFSSQIKTVSAQLLKMAPQPTLARLMRRLVRAAIEGGSDDDVSIQLLLFLGD